jgi:hypothetical protein
MIHVIASVRVKEGRRSEFVEGMVGDVSIKVFQEARQ